MFDTTFVVQTAVSAFNNAALFAPAFLWWAVLAIPLFFIVRICGNAFLERIGWTNEQQTRQRLTTACIILTFFWVVLFGGNYAVLRDNITVLPFFIAAIIFLCAMFIGSYIHRTSLQKIRASVHYRRWILPVLITSIILMVALSDTHTWWGPLLQIAALTFGFSIGIVSRHEMRLIAGTILIIMSITTAILMQPEFFRFGQLGALTFAHLFGLLIVGIFAMATLATNNISPRGRIRHGIYTKLKWLLRCIILLCILLFGLTESVPVFLGTLGITFILFALSVWHAQSVSPDLCNQLFGLCLMTFGIITTMPALTAIGMLYIGQTTDTIKWRDFRFLL